MNKWYLLLCLGLTAQFLRPSEGSSNLKIDLHDCLSHGATFEELLNAKEDIFEKCRKQTREAYEKQYAACVEACNKIAWDKKFISNFWPKKDVTSGDLDRCAKKVSFYRWLAAEKARLLRLSSFEITA